FGYLLGGRLDLPGDPEHQLLEILHQKSGLLNILLHHRRMIQGAKGAGEAKPVKTAQDPDDVSLMLLDKALDCLSESADRLLCMLNHYHKDGPLKIHAGTTISLVDGIAHARQRMGDAALGSLRSFAAENLVGIA